MGILGYFRQKGGSHPIHRDFIKKKLRIFRNFSPKGGGGSPQFRNFLIRKNWGFRIAERGGVSEFRSFSEKKTVFFYASPYCTSTLYLPCSWKRLPPLYRTTEYSGIDPDSQSSSSTGKGGLILGGVLSTLVYHFTTTTTPFLYRTTQYRGIDPRILTLRAAAALPARSLP